MEQPLDKVLEDDLQWREVELGSLKFAIGHAGPSSPRGTAILRSMWAMLYAHYEGFCIFAVNELLTRLEARGIPRDWCNDNVLAMSLNNDLGGLRSDTSSMNCLKFFRDQMPVILSRAVSFPRDPKTQDVRLSGQSNLYAEDLIANLAALGVPHPLVENYRSKINELVGRRNSIAHGKPLKINCPKLYSEMENVAFYVMHEVALGVLEAATTMTFLTPDGRTRAIATKAYEIWEGEGRPSGREELHWLRAETELFG